jgi:hypothetical protein
MAKNNYNMGDFDFTLDDEFLKQMQGNAAPAQQSMLQGSMSPGSLEIDPQTLNQINNIPKEDLLAQIKERLMSRVSKQDPAGLERERSKELEAAKPGLDVRIARGIAEFAGGMTGKKSNLGQYMAQDKAARGEVNTKFDRQSKEQQKDIELLNEFEQMDARQKLQELQSANLILGMKDNELGLKLKQQAYGDAQAARDPKSQQSAFARKTVMDAYNMEVPESVSAIQLKGYFDKAPEMMKQKAQSLIDLTKEMRKPTEGQKTIDREFAKNISKWDGGEKAAFEKSVGKLRRARNILEKDKGALIGTSGRFEGRIPDIARSEQSIALREDSQSAVNSILKGTLGAQFTEKEGERIMNQQYNETLSPEENIRRIDATIKELESKAKTFDNKVKYFNDKRTVFGFEEPKQNIKEAAHKWLQANPNHPRASAVRKKLGL